MPKFTGFFNYFTELEKLEIQDIALYAQFKNDPKILENRVGNLILYPHIIPVSTEDLTFNLGLLKAALKVSGQKLYSKNFKRIYIPQNLLEFFPDLSKLIVPFVDILNPSGITTILCKSAMGGKNLGTVIKPETLANGTVDIFIQRKRYQIKTGSFMVIPADGERVDIKFESNTSKLEKQNILITEVAGGRLGLVVDVRR